MGNEIPEEVVYTITSGFYPKLFSQDKGWKSGIGRGRKGMQWKAVQGFSEGSLKRVDGKRIEGRDKYQDFFRKMRPTKWGGSGKSWDKALEEVDGLTEDDIIGQSEKGVGKGKFKSEAEMKANLTLTQFIGNNETYKLWGSKVWYQHGWKENKKQMETDLDNWLKQKDASYLTNIYSKAEEGLVRIAVDMAHDVFGKALDKDNLRDDLESVGKEADVPEEERKEVAGVYGGAEKVDSIPPEFKKVSQARSADLKYRMKDGTALYMDSTEMPLHQANQHGITEEGAKEMEKAIKAAKEGGEKEIEALRKAVVNMFVKNIDDNNKTITKLVTKALPKEADQKKGIDSVLKIMQKIKKDNQDPKKRTRGGDPKAAVSDIAKILGISMSKPNAENTALKYIIHSIVNLAGDANQNFRQGHLAGKMTNPLTNAEENLYASVPMKLRNMKQGIPQFVKSVVTAKPPDGVVMLFGESHGLAIMEREKNLGRAVASETKARQIQAFQNGKIIGTSANNSAMGQAGANMELSMRCRPSTTVTFAPKVFEGIIKDLPKIINNSIVGDEKILKNAENHMSRQKGHKLKDYKSLKFWAMPYIGLMEYPTKAE